MKRFNKQIENDDSFRVQQVFRAEPITPSSPTTTNSTTSFPTKRNCAPFDHYHIHDHTPIPLDYETEDYQKNPILVSLDDEKYKHVVPHFLRDRFIIRGYRLYYNNLWSTFKSLFQLHNETINIYTALLPLAFFIYLLLQVLFFPVPILQEDWSARICFAIFYLSCIASFGTSTIFHWFGCINHSVNVHLVRIDICSISLLIGGSFFVPLYYAFTCYPQLLQAYLYTVSVVTIVTCVLFIVPKFSSDEWKLFRVSIFILNAALGLAPIISMLHIYGVEYDEINYHLLFIVGMYSLYALGVVFYVGRMPERFVPKVFDLIGNSHNYWHTAVFLATFVHYWNCEEMANNHIHFMTIANCLPK